MLNINNKILKYGLVGLVALVLIVSGIDYTITQIKLSKIPPSLRINTDKDNIIGAQTIPNGKIYDKEDPKKVIYEGEVVKYAYKTDKIEDKPNEVVEKRTKHSRTIKVAEDDEKITYQLEVISGVPQYYEDENGEWYQADYGTTDINTYALETKGTLLAQLFSPEKVYATEGTFYPDADPETTSVDGYVGRHSVNEIFTTIRNGTGAGFNDASTTIAAQLNASTTSNQYDALWRGILTFNTSSIVSSASIINSQLSLYGSGKNNGLGNPDLYIADASPISNTALQANDFSNISRISFGSVTYASWSITSYNDITENSSGISNINKTGITKRSIQLSWDLLNNTTGLSWVSGLQAYIYAFSAEETGTSKDPKLVVTYGVPVPGNFFQMF